MIAYPTSFAGAQEIMLALLILARHWAWMIENERVA